MVTPRLLRSAILLALLPLCRGDDDAVSRRSLKSLPGVLVVIDDLKETMTDACRPLEADQLTTDIELKLRKAGIAILSLDQYEKAPGRPIMFAHIVCMGDEHKAYGNATLSVSQDVVLARDQSTHQHLVTWSVSGGLGEAKHEALERTIRDKLADQVDKFLNAYLAANTSSR